MSKSTERPEIPIHITSAYGQNSREPFVTLVVGETMYQWPSADAKRIGLLLVEVALAAEADAFLVEWGSDALEDERAALLLLGEFRKWRQKRLKGDEPT